jgi:thiamine transport system substrate-binding protein
MRARVLTTITALTAATLLAGGCSLVGQEDDDKGGVKSTQVTLVTHESFNLPKALVAQFEKDTGYHLTISKLADAGALTNQLVLTKDDPVGDVVFGVDNTFATRAIDEGVFDSYEPDLPSGADAYQLPGSAGEVTPIDDGNVCVNVDSAWFRAHDLAEPQTIADLTDPAYKDLLVIPAATTSSPGLAFLLATIGRYGDQWQGYWEDLTRNGAKVVKGWSEAYFEDFTFSGGDRPIVVSYDSSPAFTLNKAGTKTSTRALLDGCFQQVEYAGVLKGEGTNVDGAHAVIDWLLSPEVQASLPEEMYVFPVDPAVELPAVWAKFAKRPTTTEKVDPAEITEQRKTWLEEWSDITSR